MACKGRIPARPPARRPGRQGAGPRKGADGGDAGGTGRAGTAIGRASAPLKALGCRGSRFLEPGKAPQDGRRPAGARQLPPGQARPARKALAGSGKSRARGRTEAAGPTRGGRGRPPARTERPCAPGIMVAALSRQGSARAGSSAGKAGYWRRVRGVIGIILRRGRHLRRGAVPIANMP